MNKGDVIQIKPDAGTTMDGWVCVVDEVKTWGVIAMAFAPGGFAFVRLPHDGFVHLQNGRVECMPTPDGREE